MDNSANNNQNKPNPPAPIKSGPAPSSPATGGVQSEPAGSDQTGASQPQAGPAANPPQTPPLPQAQPPPAPPPVSTPLEGASAVSTIPTASSVVANKPQEKLPKWFYVIFAIVAVVFLIITGLLVMTVLNKQKSGGGVEILPTQAVSQNEAKNISPSVIPTVEEDQLTATIGATSESDDVESLEKDINNSDATGLEEDLNNFEAELKPTP